MNLRVYRSLYWANQGLIYAAQAIEDLSREQGLPQMKLQEFQALIEETRASMNSLIGERIDQHETERASRLEIVRSSRERAEADLTSEEHVPTNGSKSGPSGPRKR
jgi:hypothetical protein